MEKIKLSELSLTELQTLLDLLKNGDIDGYSSQRIALEADGYQSGHEKWKERKKLRSEQLKNIRNAIVEKAKEIDY